MLRSSSVGPRGGLMKRGGLPGGDRALLASQSPAMPVVRGLVGGDCGADSGERGERFGGVPGGESGRDSLIMRGEIALPGFDDRPAAA